jgi:hypothetical protein
MTHVQAVAGGIRKFNQAVEFRLGMVFAGGERLMIVPVFLPFGFDLGRYIGFHRHG